MSRNIVAIVNAASGSGRKLDRLREVVRCVEDRGGRITVQETNHPGHATELAAELNGSVDAVLAVGGDGTLNEIINGLDGSATPLLALPVGTENLFALEVGMPRDPRSVAETLLSGQPVTCDMGLVNGRRFLVVVGVGADAEVVRRLDETRSGNITRWSYLGPALRTLWAYRFPAIEVDVDGCRVFEGPGVALVGGIKHYASHVPVFPRARVDDGLLDICVLPCRTRTQLLMHAMRMQMQRHIDRGGVFYGQGSHISIRSDEPVATEVDGEVGGDLPVEISVAPRGLTVLRLGDG